MTREERCAILDGAKDAFFEAMLDGFVGCKFEKSTVTKINAGCTKIIVFRNGEYTVSDEWFANPHSNRSAGSTIITFCNVPIWTMSYGGFYTKGVIPTLKSILKDSYERRSFHGCRGANTERLVYIPHSIEVKLKYINKHEGNFERFNGVEKILSISPFDNIENLSGYHEYFGMALI